MKVVNDIQPDETDLSLDLKESLKVMRDRQDQDQDKEIKLLE